MAKKQMSLLQGTLDVLVLKAVAAEPRHGYGVAEWIRATTDGTLEVEDGALYTSLHRMHKRGWLESEWGKSELGRKAKFYRLTPAGRERLRQETEEWGRFMDAVAAVLSPA